LAAAGNWDAMPGLIDDTMLATFAIDVAPADVGPALREKYGGLADRITLSPDAGAETIAVLRT
jgi:hypothetical protein